MLNPYHDKIDIQRIIALQGAQYQDALYLEQSVPANSQIDAPTLISSLGHFMLLTMSGSFTTLDTVAAVTTDTYVCPLYCQLIDGSNQRTLFESPVPASLFLSPGKENVSGVTQLNPPQPLFLEFPFIYTFPINSSIIMRIRNSAAYANTLKVFFKGIRVFDKARANS